MTSPYTFSAPTEVVAGVGALGGLGALVERLAPARIAVVSDEGVAGAGLLEMALAGLTRWEVRVCALIRPDPTVDDVEAVAREAIEHGSELVVAIGGGSGLAAGKGVALRLRNAGRIEEYAGRDRAPARPAPCIAIPTTAGSGSEVSNALVLHDPRRPSVLVVRGRGYEPDVAVLDGALIRSLPRLPMVYAALDALSHAVEALWAVKASPFTDALACAAADRIHDVLPRALESREPEDLQALLEASAMANLACGSSELTLVHALSLSSAVHLAHGYQNAVLLPHVAAFNRGAVLARVPARVPARAAAEIERILPLYERIGFEARFRAGEIDAEQAQSMIDVALDSPLHANNARRASADELRDLLASAGAPAIVSSTDT